jgi:GAF domain-containing protein
MPNTVPLPKPACLSTFVRVATSVELLASFGLLSVNSEMRFDALASLARQICGADAAFVALLDPVEERIFYKGSSYKEDSELGAGVASKLAGCEAALPDGERSFSAISAATCKPLVVLDAAADAAWAQSSLVRTCGVRFFAGVPLEVAPDRAVGCLCVMSFAPRSEFGEGDTATLAAVALQAVAQMQLGLHERCLAKLNAQLAAAGAEHGRCAGGPAAPCALQTRRARWRAGVA